MHFGIHMLTSTINSYMFSFCHFVCPISWRRHLQLLNIESPQEWQIKWPRPAFNQLALDIIVEADGTMHMHEWSHKALEQLHAMGFPASRTKKVTELMTLLNGKNNLVDIFRASATCDKARNFHKQLLWSCGLQLQQLLGLLIQGKAEDPAMKAKVVKMADVLENPNLLDRQLVRYLQNAQEVAAAQGHFSFSCATDKSSVAGLGHGLQNTVFVLANNKAIFSPPQAIILYM